MSSYKATADRLLKHFSQRADAGPIYKINEITSGGDDTPLNPGSTVEQKQILEDALFVSTMQHSEQGRTDIKYDRILMTKGESPLEVNTLVEENGRRFVVVDTDPLEPGTNGALAHRNYVSKA